MWERMVTFFLTPVGWLTIYLVGMNLGTFAVYGVDKWKARHQRYRVPEKTLFLLAILGGSVGALGGMYAFHHKTRHWYFHYGIPLILLLQILLPILAVYLIK